jgi:hypothetical protein
MNYLTFFILLFLTFIYAQSPCDDPKYIELKKKPFENMSQREFEYFMLKEKFCIESKEKYENKLCTLIVTLDSVNIEGRVKQFSIFVDDVENIPKSKKTILTISPGIHKISLFSLTEIEDFEKKINRRILTNENKNYFYGIGVMEAKLKQMKNTVKTINAVPAGKISINYRFICDTLKAGKCSDESWSLIPEIN